MIKGAILGLGFIGKVHYKAFKNSEIADGPLRLEACFDINEENFEGIDCNRKYTDLDEFFEKEKDRIDFVDICLPTFMHKDISQKAMEHGFHVLCEKPMALKLEDCNDMIDSCAKYNKKLMIAQVLRFDGEFNVIKDYIDNNTLGNVKNVHYTTYRTGLPDGEANWFKKKELSGGTIFDVHVHDTDLILYYFGMPQKLVSVANTDTRGLGIESFSTNLYYGKDFFVNFHCDMALAHSGHYKDRTLRINFEKGYIIKDEYKFIAVDENGNETDLSLGHDENLMYQNEIEYFAKAIQSNGDLSRCNPEQSANAIKIVISEIHSSENCGEMIYF